MSIDRHCGILGRILAALCAGSVPSLALAQDLGHGSLQANGREPLLQLEGAAPGGQLWIRARSIDQDPQAPPLAYVLLSAERLALPLDPVGLPGAVLGIGTSGMTVLGPLSITAQGTIDLPMRVEPAWRGATVYAQLLVVDPRIAPVPLAFSDSRSMTLGSGGRVLVLVKDGAPGRIELARLFADGRAGTPLPDLRDLVLLDLALASTSEAHAFRGDRARVERLAGADTLRLADGGRLVRYQRAGTTTLGLAHVLSDGRARIVLESSGVVTGHEAIDPLVAASSFGPYVAFVVNDAHTRCCFYRTDGENLAGSAEPLREITPAAALAIEPGAMVFGTDVLVYVDDVLGPHRVRLDGSSPALRYALPPTGGGAPSAFDEEIAVSGDGRFFALGAGLTRRSKDVYVLRDDGAATNVTQSPADYAEVGYSNAGHRLEMTLNHDGTLVSYVTESTPEPETFLRSLTSPVVFHLTNSQTFVDSIDVGGVGQLPLFGGALVIAGLDAQSLDFFYTPTGQPQNVVNLTQTGTNPTNPPFGLGGQLALNDLGTLESAPQLLVSTFDRRVARNTLLALDLQAATSRLVADPIDGPVLALSGTEAAIASGNALVFVRPADLTAGYRRSIALGGPARLLSRASATELFAAVGASAASRVLWRFDATSASGAPLDPQPAAIDDVVAGRVAGVVLTLRGGALATTDPQGATVVRGGSGLRAILTRE